jgi:hypothetical protein
VGWQAVRAASGGQPCFGDGDVSSVLSAEIADIQTAQSNFVMQTLDEVELPDCESKL